VLVSKELRGVDAFLPESPAGTLEGLDESAGYRAFIEAERAVREKGKKLKKIGE
jgi:hypothetical protein